MATKRFSIGDPVFHPRCGFGIVEGITHRDPAHPMQVNASGPTEDYYDIGLLQGGSLLLPVANAALVGLRAVKTGIDEIRASLNSPAQSLPENSRARTAELQARMQSDEPAALAGAVRDLLARRSGQRLSTSEKTWLDRSCAQLSSEAALVDNIGEAEARALIDDMVSKLVESQE